MQLHIKLYGSEEELKKTATFILQTELLAQLGDRVDVHDRKKNHQTDFASRPCAE